MHVLPKGFHRIRHCGLLASGTKAETIARARELIAAAQPVPPTPKEQACDGGAAATAEKPAHTCPCCGGRMVIIEMFEASQTPRHRPTVPAIIIRIDTS